MKPRKRTTPIRDSKGMFVKGHAGIRKKGTKYFKGLGPLLRAKEPEVLRKALEQALSGDQPQLMTFFLKKMYGSMTISDFALEGDLKAMMGQILASVGKEDPSTLSAAAKLLEVHCKIVELDELSERIAALENASKN
jgi:hypothetical protein